MATAPVSPSLSELRDRLTDLMPHDHRRLRRRIEGAHKIRDQEALRGVVAEISADITAAHERVTRRRERLPEITYPEELPVTARREDLMTAIRDNQVVIVAGETGSGKTTQLPKMCLELGRGILGSIGHTQPRRLAARTVAERVAAELDTEVGGAVGYQVRFTERAGEDTLVKQMTDGILLAEIQRDRLLRRYDTLIIDEAHERSLNIDFILGYVKQILPKRPDLKVIITSATIDPERFSRHFDDAPIVEVSGRTYPVEVRYRPLVDDSDELEDVERDQITAIGDAVDELCAEGPGDILVFLSGEREIRDTAEALEQRKPARTEVLPLYARLSSAEQQRVFQRHSTRRIVLATNVAETSLTVPGIKYVIDPGTARISRYSYRTRVQRLPIEAISQASANQRKGRCGRESEGICIRLYSERDFLDRQEFTDPEILRTNLASVILRMTSLGLGDVASFPFVEPPDRRQITDGVNLLHELGALEQPTKGGKQDNQRLTRIGSKLAQLPIDPRLARMIVEAETNGCVHETMVIAAGLSIQDPRERPAEHQQAADQQHARFANKQSDFLAYLNLWQYLREQRGELSGSRFRRMCREEYLNYLRVREWQDLYGQLRQMVNSLDISINDQPADEDRIHQSLLAGLLSHIGLKDTERKSGANRRSTSEYLGARGAKFAIFPGSALFKKQPQWVMAAELVETSKLWARTVAKVEPAWIERLAGHLVKRHYSEPHWEKDKGAVMAYERVTLYGVPLVSGRKVNYGRIEPELCRELFIRHALVEGDWDTRHEFFHTNRRLLAEVEELEQRARRRDIVVDDDTLHDFYDQRVGAEVVSARHFDTWWKKVRRERPDLLTFPRSLLFNETSAGVTDTDYPDFWQQGRHRLRLSYQFEPGSDADGVTVHVPLAVLNQLGPGGFDWQIPGLREELVTSLLKTLPKQWRREFVPVPDHAKAVLARLRPHEEPLLEALSNELRRMTGVTVPPEAWDPQRVPDHLRMTFRVVDGDGDGGEERVLAEGKDLEELAERLRPRLRAEISAAAETIERHGLREWDFGKLPGTFERQRNGQVVKAYPALVDEGDSVGIRAFDTAAEQREQQRRGARRLVLLNLPSPAKFLRRQLTNSAKLVFGRSPHGDQERLFEDCIACAADVLIEQAGGVPSDQEAFDRVVQRVRAGLNETSAHVVSAVERILTIQQRVESEVEGTRSLSADAAEDIRTQLSNLVYPGFVTDAGWWRLADLRRYLSAVSYRLQKVAHHPARDRDLMDRIRSVERRYQEMLDSVGEGEPVGERLWSVGWMIEELRVSYFAQELGTPRSISEKRIHREMDKLQP
ncbi:ATP-dependent helicase [Actinopolyspora erythraea]|uniref:RNA helicase n=1 Tax=Actinopolyspora erythraea TaxID=414996 RepID=A0A099D1Y1_9ACTN|nr:ATP-dependent RNA helicase HrpA [Actinopolyspora erythraea]ASU77843.1 ATP-dependent helicase [Actinopolyspora erythraea]KGI79832.1 ATP-dependent helicase [Actinopolyspora erythraea]